MNWLKEVRNDIDKVDDLVTYYENELKNAKDEVKIEGFVEQQARTMPAIMDKRFSQLQEVEAVHDYLDAELKRIRSHFYRQYLENYKRSLGSRDIEKYIDGESAVVEMLYRINQVRLVRNRYASITKALEIKHFQLTNIVKMKVAGLDDADLGIQ